jgi:hypothetical protein
MAKHKYIETPEKMWELFLKYKEGVKAKPILKHVFVGKDGDSNWEQREKPLTMEGFENWCADNGIIEDLSHYFCNLDNRYFEYVAICSRVRKAIRQDQIEGGMVGIYNPSITQRLNGLTEKTENKNENTNIEIKADFGNPIENKTNTNE